MPRPPPGIGAGLTLYFWLSAASLAPLNPFCQGTPSWGVPSSGPPVGPGAPSLSVSPPKTIRLPGICPWGRSEPVPGEWGLEDGCSMQQTTPPTSHPLSDPPNTAGRSRGSHCRRCRRDRGQSSGVQGAAAPTSLCEREQGRCCGNSADTGPRGDPNDPPGMPEGATRPRRLLGAEGVRGAGSGSGIPTAGGQRRGSNPAAERAGDTGLCRGRGGGEGEDPR